MIVRRCFLPVGLTLALVGACDSSAKDKTPTKVSKSDAKKGVEGDKKAEGKGPAPSGAHGSPNANPHAGNANPHAGMPPMMGKPPAPKGPPRDVTPSGETTAETLPGLAFSVPKEWEKGTPTNSMRKAQYVLPGPGGDGELVVFRFPGGAGGIEANLTRWKGQFKPPEGKTIDDVATTKTVVAGSLETTVVDVSGTYVAAMTPGSDAKRNDADQRMLAAIIEGSGDPYYFKAVGPKATLDVWAAGFETMVSSFAAGEDASAAPTAPAADGDAKAPAEKKGEGDAKAPAEKKGEG